MSVLLEPNIWWACKYGNYWRGRTKCWLHFAMRAMVPQILEGSFSASWDHNPLSEERGRFPESKARTLHDHAEKLFEKKSHGFFPCLAHRRGLILSFDWKCILFMVSSKEESVKRIQWMASDVDGHVDSDVQLSCCLCNSLKCLSTFWIGCHRFQIGV